MKTMDFNEETADIQELNFIWNGTNYNTIEGNYLKEKMIVIKYLDTCTIT